MATTNGHTVQPAGAETKWAPLIGRWEAREGGIDYLGEGPAAHAHGQSFPMGLVVSNRELKRGDCSARVRFEAAFDGAHQAGGIVLGYHSTQERYLMVQLGAGEKAYSIGEFQPSFGWRTLLGEGLASNLEHGKDYVMQVNLAGQRVTIQVDGVPVVDHLLSRPLEGKQAGLIAAGARKVSFSSFEVADSRPKAFVAMKFEEPYDTLYREVISKQAERDFEVVRIDEKAGPGVIFQDIQREIEQADVVIAEITPQNPNVFYELGYAHALGKPTILLAKRGSELPFDIRSYRVVFYNDTIGGKPEVERSLQKHLEAVRQG